MISSQLDMDRMDYLNRDSFYTGVIEGSIGADRLIKMLDISQDQLVVEEKGIVKYRKFSSCAPAYVLAGLSAQNFTQRAGHAYRDFETCP